MIRVSGYSPEEVALPKIPTATGDKEVELRYDDGTAERRASMGTDFHVVSFPPPKIPWIINKVKIYGMGYGTATGKEFRIQIWDKNLNVLVDKTFPYNVFSNIEKWVDASIPSTVVSDDFYIAIFTGSSDKDGIYVALDNTTRNYNSYIFQAGKVKIEDWYEAGQSYIFNGFMGEFNTK